MYVGECGAMHSLLCVNNNQIVGLQNQSTPIKFKRTNTTCPKPFLKFCMFLVFKEAAFIGSVAWLRSGLRKETGRTFCLSRNVLWCDLVGTSSKFKLKMAAVFPAHFFLLHLIFLFSYYFLFFYLLWLILFYFPFIHQMVVHLSSSVSPYSFVLLFFIFLFHYIFIFLRIFLHCLSYFWK
jgi:hypothetical protein